MYIQPNLNEHSLTKFLRPNFLLLSLRVNYRAVAVRGLNGGIHFFSGVPKQN
jgi:hypothetical protein